MTPYDEVPGHPLAGVPPEIIRTARAVLGQARDVDLHDTDDRNALADAVTLALRQSGHLTWHTWSPGPDRESLILGLNLAINAYLADDEARRRGTVVELVVDDVILPLLRRSNGDAGTTAPADEGGGVRRADAGA